MKDFDLSRFNDRVKEWGKQKVSEFKSEGQRLGIKHRAASYSDVASRKSFSSSDSPDDSLQKLRDAYRQKDGAITVVSFKVRRSLIYTHHGAGKGRGGEKGSRWTDPAGNTKGTKRSSLGKMGTGGRRAKPFLSNVLGRESGVDELASIAADELGTIVISKFAASK